jgi:hypothetical protein
VRDVTGIGHFIGEYTLHEPGDGDGIKADDFLLVANKLEPFAFVDTDGKVIITIDESFITDGATTPWFLQSVPWLRRYGRIRRAAFCHDWAWTLHHLGRELFGFWKSNAMFYRACRVCGLSVFEAGTCWLAVTLFGWPMWMGKERCQAKARAKVNIAGVVMRQKGIVR